MIEDDFTGRSRLLRNTFVGWASQLILIVGGFIMPRLMHESLGQVVLGVWDFGWTFVAYVNLMSLGIGSSINRFVAQYRSANNPELLNGLVSTVVVIQILISILTLVATIGAYFSLGFFFSADFGGEIETARTILLILGICVSVEMLANPARGVMSGYHRWDIHNGIHAGSYIVSFVLMAGVMLFGGSLVDVGIAYLVTIVAFEIIRLRLAYWIAPEIKLSLTYCSFDYVKLTFAFGAKSLMLSAPSIILTQTVLVITVSLAGPAGLAVFSRPNALVRHINTLVFKFTGMLTPIVGSIDVLNSTRELKDFIMKAARYNFLMTIPPIAFLAIFGHTIVGIWMGREYENELLVVVLALGFLLPIGQDGMIRVMQGLDMHGKLAVPLSVTTFFFSVLAFVCLNERDWTLVSSALLLTVPLTLAYGIVLPWYSCNSMNISKTGYLLQVTLLPLVYNLPFIAGLISARYLLHHEQYYASSITILVSIAAEIAAYYYFVLPKPFKQMLAARINALNLKRLTPT